MMILKRKIRVRKAVTRVTRKTNITVITWYGQVSSFISIDGRTREAI